MGAATKGSGSTRRASTPAKSSRWADSNPILARTTPLHPQAQPALTEHMEDSSSTVQGRRWSEAVEDTTIRVAVRERTRGSIRRAILLIVVKRRGRRTAAIRGKAMGDTVAQCTKEERNTMRGSGMAGRVDTVGSMR